MSPNMLKILVALSESGGEWYLNFAGIHRRSGVDKILIRRTVRRLARQGLAEYGKGLWTDEGEPAGSGYRITADGLKHLAGLETS